jgi:hypothetical protein
MHEMEGPRRVLLPCFRRSLGVRRPCRTCSSCSVSRLLASRARGTGCSLRSAGPDCSGPAPTRSGCPSRSAGPDRSGPAPTRSSLLAVRQSRLLGSSSYEERSPRRPGPDRSGPASAGLPRLALPRLLKTARRAASSDVRPGDCSPVHTSELIIFFGNPLRTAVSRCSPRPRSRPPGRSPFPVTRRFLMAFTLPHKGFPAAFSTSFGIHRTVHRRWTFVPRNPGVVHCVIHRYVHSHLPDRPPSGHDPPTPEADRLPACAINRHPVRFAQPARICGGAP